MSMWEEFKTFAFKGNVIDLAVGLVIGASFSGIVKSIVDNLIMPPIGLLVGGIDFGELYVVLKQPPGGQRFATAEELVKAGGVAFRYGLVVNATVSFFLVAIAVFVLVKAVNKMTRREAPPPTTRDCPECLMAIPLKATKCGHCTSPVPLVK